MQPCEPVARRARIVPRAAQRVRRFCQARNLAAKWLKTGTGRAAARTRQGEATVQSMRHVTVLRREPIRRSLRFCRSCDVLRFWNRDGKGLSNVYNALWRLLAL